MPIFDLISIGSVTVRRGGALEAGTFDAGVWTADMAPQMLLVDGFGIHNGVAYFDDLQVTAGDEAQLYLVPAVPEIQVGQ